MCRRLWLCVAVVLLFGGCGKPTHESVMRQLFQRTREITGVLRDVKDEASAKAAAPKLKTLAAAMQTLKNQFKAMGPPSKESEAHLGAVLGEDSKSVMEDLTKELLRVSTDPKLQVPLKEAMADIQKAQ